ncbi:MAG: pyridoxal-5'-phosphate-dependent protein beta subunit [Gemmatimonadetes bacterium]|nr:MAG: pyridoxal-5'-phosphate-dependent protein beta subunit [Gemmatimonadota bacterium]
MTTMTASEIELVTLADIESAARGLAGVATRTPLLPFDTITERLGVPVFVKPEMLQRGGAFKFRGAFTYLSRLAPAARERGVIAPSSGNHAQAVALAAKLFGVPATVVMPTTVTPAKRVGAERLGARIVLAGTTTSERYEKALELAHLEGSTLVPPYDDPAIIAGQGTVGLEIASDAPQVGTVIVQVGGGGLSAGVATAIKERVPSARVVAVEPAGAPKLSRARAAGRPVRLDKTSSIADGLMAIEIGGLPFAHHQRYVDDVVTVDDALLAPAVRLLIDRMKLVTEPSGAITIAALMEGLVRPNDARPVVAVLSGGNIEWDGLQELLARA